MPTSPTDRKASVPDFSDVPLTPPASAGSPASAASAGEWQAAVAKAADGAEAPLWETPEGITVKPLYTGEDLEGLDALHSYPGIAPYLRGPYPTMYVNQPWTIRQYAGFSTAEESNAWVPDHSFLSGG
ncbi:methylmalonyl-CoA mutase family protein, partial [Streptomyces rubiginosohelvolus]